MVVGAEWWCGAARGVCLITVIFFILGNAMYSLLTFFEQMGPFGTYYAMIASRFIVGISSGGVRSVLLLRCRIMKKIDTLNLYSFLMHFVESAKKVPYG